MKLDVVKKTGYVFENNIYDDKASLVNTIFRAHVKQWISSRYPSLPPETIFHMATDISTEFYYLKELEAEIRHEVSIIVG